MAKILVVEDDRDIREWMIRVLTDLGHSVKGFEDPVDALAAFNQESLNSQSRFDLLLTDFNLLNVGENGLWLIAQIWQIEPDMPCILMSANPAAVRGSAQIPLKVIVFEKTLDKGEINEVISLALSKDV